eukprot:6393619-Prymnesium_polylepis.1
MIMWAQGCGFQSLTVLVCGEISVLRVWPGRPRTLHRSRRNANNPHRPARIARQANSHFQSGRVTVTASGQRVTPAPRRRRRSHPGRRRRSTP